MAAKLKDGVFLGDFEAAQDLEFIVANKITRIINCVGREIANSWERSGIRYLTYYWPESGNCIVFDESNTVLDEIYSFIEEALEVGESVLIHSTDGVSRASFCSSVYFMLKYRWTLQKTFSYLVSKRPDLQPKPGFMRQLQALEASLQKAARQSARGPNDPNLRRCAEWDPSLVTTDPALGYDDDEAMLVHTYLNSQAVPEEVVIAAQSSMPLPRASQAARARRRGLTWIDDSKRSGTTHGDVPLGGATRKPTVERPPSASYSSLALGPGWVDPTGAAQSTNPRLPGAPLVAPTMGGMVSAAGAALPAQAAVRAILKGGAAWHADRKARRAGLEQESSVGADAPGGGPASLLGSTRGPPPPSSSTSSQEGSRPASARQQQVQGQMQQQASGQGSSSAAQWSATSVGQAGGGASRGAGAMPNAGMGGMTAPGGGPVRAVHSMKPSDLGATFGVPGQRGGGPSLLAESLASLSSGNLGKTLGTQSSGQGMGIGGAGGAGANLGSSLTSSLTGSNGAIALGVQPGRGASSRVRGYSPGPGRLKGSTGPSGGPAQGMAGPTGRTSTNSPDDDSPLGNSGVGKGFGGAVSMSSGGGGRPGSSGGQAPPTRTQAGGQAQAGTTLSSSSSSLLVPQMRVQSSGLVNYVSQTGLGSTSGGGGAAGVLGGTGGNSLGQMPFGASYGAPGSSTVGMANSYGYNPYNTGRRVRR